MFPQAQALEYYIDNAVETVIFSLMQVKQVFYSPKDLAIIFDMTVRQVYFHAHRGSEGFPVPKMIGTGRKKTMRFSIEDTQNCVSSWRDDE